MKPRPTCGIACASPAPPPTSSRPHALREMYRLSGGVPRVINVIADRALLGAYTQDRHRVDGSLVRAAATEVFGRHLRAGVAAVGRRRCGGARARRHRRRCCGNSRRGPAPRRSWRARRRDQRLGREPRGRTSLTAAEPTAAAPAAHCRVASLPAGSRRSPLDRSCWRNIGSETVPDEAFSKLFGLWGAALRRRQEDPVHAGHHAGPRVPRPARLVRPAAPVQPPGDPAVERRRRQRRIRSCSRVSATSAPRSSSAAQRHEVGIGELSRYWFGDFVHAVAARPRRGEAAVRSACAAMTCAGFGSPCSGSAASPPDAPASDVFDAELSTPVREFQRRNQLAVDGIAGVQTQIVLASAVVGHRFPAAAHRPGTRRLNHVLHPRRAEEIRERSPAAERARALRSARAAAALEVSAAGRRHRVAAGGESRRGRVAHAAQACGRRGAADATGRCAAAPAVQRPRQPRAWTRRPAALRLAGYRRSTRRPVPSRLRNVPPPGYGRNAHPRMAPANGIRTGSAHPQQSRRLSAAAARRRRLPEPGSSRADQGAYPGPLLAEPQRSDPAAQPGRLRARPRARRRAAWSAAAPSAATMSGLPTYEEAAGTDATSRRCTWTCTATPPIPRSASC